MKIRNRFICILVLIIMAVVGTSACDGSTSDSPSRNPVNPQVQGSASANTNVISAQISASSSQTSQSWIPEIIVGETGAEVPNIDDSVKYDYSASKLSFRVANGTFSETNVSNKISNWTTTGTNNLLYTTSVAFPYGTITCNVKTLTTTDSGIVFGLSSSSTTFWEGSGISYYFFFLSQEGTAYLGKTNNSTWSILKQVAYNFNDTDTYQLKVIYQGSKICCYVNNEFMIGVRDIAPLSGTAFGIRSGASGVSFTDLAITNDYLY